MTTPTAAHPKLTGGRERALARRGWASRLLSLMAQGKSNASIVRTMTVSLGAVEKHTQRIFAKLGLLPDDGSGNRRVLAVLAYLRG